MIPPGAAPRRVDDELAGLNQALYDEFVRTTGATDRHDFVAWIADLRESACAAMGGRISWAELSSREQAAMLLGRLRASPPASWPSIDLTA